MDAATLAQIIDFINQNIDDFHENRLKRIQEMRLKDVLKRKNPYLFRAKNITTAPALIQSLMDATLSSSEEGIFGNFLEALAIFVAQRYCGGQKSSSPGIDLEFSRDGVRYIVAIKSGPNWGNSSQKRALLENFKGAIRILKQSKGMQVQAVLGTCYGKCAATDNGVHLSLCGQKFWEFISGDAEFYKQLVVPIGYRSPEHNFAFEAEKMQTFHRLVNEFSAEFCHPSGEINWGKLVEFNSGG